VGFKIEIGVGVKASRVGVGGVGDGVGSETSFGLERDLPRRKPPIPTRARNKTKIAIKGEGDLGVCSGMIELSC